MDARGVRFTLIERDARLCVTCSAHSLLAPVAQPLQLPRQTQTHEQLRLEQLRYFDVLPLGARLAVLRDAGVQRDEIVFPRDLKPEWCRGFTEEYGAPLADDHILIVGFAAAERLIKYYYQLLEYRPPPPERTDSYDTID